MSPPAYKVHYTTYIPFRKFCLRIESRQKIVKPQTLLYKNPGWVRQGYKDKSKKKKITAQKKEEEKSKKLNKTASLNSYTS